ncbi:hypothetical protein PGT21_001093 [Puccinia graminis f. sp. tritici]|uniref:Uncharacterized protein n=1 Tax=Puccinia graminis f. sp. tritici TaxID=56615 RepID=A0A5B0MA60_PUCGR|nr:hypothetical protein PGT21_001093 [Puccinia graminis f. sp. tritici]
MRSVAASGVTNPEPIKIINATISSDTHPHTPHTDTDTDTDTVAKLFTSQSQQQPPTHSPRSSITPRTTPALASDLNDSHTSKIKSLAVDRYTSSSASVVNQLPTLEPGS